MLSSLPTPPPTGGALKRVPKWTRTTSSLVEEGLLLLLLVAAHNSGTMVMLSSVRRGSWNLASRAAVAASRSASKETRQGTVALRLWGAQEDTRQEGWTKAAALLIAGTGLLGVMGAMDVAHNEAAAAPTVSKQARRQGEAGIGGLARGQWRCAALRTKPNQKWRIFFMKVYDKHVLILVPSFLSTIRRSPWRARRRQWPRRQHPQRRRQGQRARSSRRAG